MLGGKKEASRALLKAGVPGVRYLDQGSRKKGEGTHNLVMFDEKGIRLLERNGEDLSQLSVNPQPSNPMMGGLLDDNRPAASWEKEIRDGMHGEDIDHAAVNFLTGYRITNFDKEKEYLKRWVRDAVAFPIEFSPATVGAAARKIVGEPRSGFRAGRTRSASAWEATVDGARSGRSSD